ncbi:hypothetical protein CLAFUW4_08832 [Fulvia fulva]|uniref:DUF998 domain-containing protein n=1 Tax=Passalora fulva TaxID=5499 RepID=A0A9Q8PGP9_PASFU|nr:uncharacterized protein CLAFUR5_08938 [Fulvia fulva]KAK4614022.1 hypothetical protein CLAFUR4_08838 [Fulvia fulva]KAK4614725.1 hypothetical protein CLAFUR0_08830 [Fulvia fulva]UJO22087.1 hypothetical protein CLAFUR5_08938 [Fulvia fulva]WPV20385.1 hypothetical protein CLAFUW4_08832 [Fulvia fulva]WPV35398.1 hypothetical protein CLAFUW7_08833 [Fulvia fulva]
MPGNKVTKMPSGTTLFQQMKPLAITAAVIFLALPIIYVGIEYTTSLAFIESYSYIKNHTSDLGIPYAYTDPLTNLQTYSYKAQLMRLNFVVNGFLYYIGHTVLLQATTPLTGGRYNLPRAAVSVIYCLGIVLVAAVPGGPGEKQDGKAVWHVVGAAMAIVGANVNIILAGLAAPSTTQPVYRGLCLLLGTVGSVGLAIFVARHGGGMQGFWQRSSIYPNHVWKFLTGIHLVYLLMQSKTADAIKRE